MLTSFNQQSDKWEGWEQGKLVVLSQNATSAQAVRSESGSSSRLTAPGAPSFRRRGVTWKLVNEPESGDRRPWEDEAMTQLRVCEVLSFQKCSIIPDFLKSYPLGEPCYLSLP